MVKWSAVFAVLAMVVSSNSHVVSASCMAKTYSFVAEETATPTPTTSVAAETTAPSTATDAPVTETTAPVEETTVSTAASSVSGSSGSDISIDTTIQATSTIESTYTNWVGPTLGDGSDSACYREAHVMSTCPLGFDYTLETCWAECPLAYPVECGMECIRQNDDCGLEVLTKVATVANSVLTAATLGVFGEFKVLAQAVQLGVKCSKGMIGLVKSIAKYIRNIQVSDPSTSEDKLLAILYQADVVVIDLPVAICTCLGVKVPENAKFTDQVVTTAEFVLKEVLSNADGIVGSWDSFTSFLSNASLADSVSTLNETDITSLQTALDSNSTCGYDMKRLTDRTWMFVADVRAATPDLSEDDLRVAMSQSDLVLYEIPTVTNNCMEELVAGSDEETAYSTRDTLRKTLGVIVDDLIESGTSDNGTYLSAAEYAEKVVDKGLGLFAIWDVTSIAGLVAEFLQTVCGPTEFIGEIDDGTDDDTLGFSTVGDAFNGSTSSWTKVGDGTVVITFTSVDTEDVTVNIMSGGNDYDEVAVAAGETVAWSSNVTDLGGKTLYLDRWRPGFLGLPGTGGGSLLLWVPRSSEGGHLELAANLNVS